MELLFVFLRADVYVLMTVCGLKIEVSHLIYFSDLDMTLGCDSSSQWGV